MSYSDERLAYVSRPLLESDHQLLFDQALNLKRGWPDSEVFAARAVGKAALTLIEPGMYREAIAGTDSKLRHKTAQSVAKVLNESLSSMPTEHTKMSVQTLEPVFLGSHIAYVVEPDEGYPEDQLDRERSRFLAVLRRMNGHKLPWRDFTPHISVAQVDPIHVGDEDLLQAFGDFMPPTLTLLPARAFYI